MNPDGLMLVFNCEKKTKFIVWSYVVCHKAAVWSSSTNHMFADCDELITLPPKSYDTDSNAMNKNSNSIDTCVTKQIFKTELSRANIRICGA